MTVHTADSATFTADALSELKSLLGDRILLDDEVRELYRSDFGRTVNRLPGAVARCTSAEEVAEVVRFCRERKIPVVPRGQAHTQSGQTTTDHGVVLDTSVRPAKPPPSTAASSGATWSPPAWKRG